VCLCVCARARAINAIIRGMRDSCARVCAFVGLCVLTHARTHACVRAFIIRLLSTDLVFRHTMRTRVAHRCSLSTNASDALAVAAAHYRRAFLRQLHKMVGSAEFIGNP
jgi:hypothetical protein